MAAIFPRLSPRTYRQDAVQSIRAAISEGTLTGGTPLVERRIAEDMGISRAPVREALRQLEEEGLIVNIPFKGWYVTEVTPKAMAEIVSLRRVVEAFAAERAAEFVKPAEMRELQRLHAEMERAAAKDDPDGLLELHLRFHGRFYELAGHDLLRQVWTTMEGQLRLYLRLHQLTYDTLPHYVEAHRPILDALLARDAEALKAAITEHLGEHTEQLIH
ncbi:MAG TPA: GntR family transcriptional regulator [Chloroflexota bacterium]|nr:GntR family transcriptional regulator [Chloroflexota bacterium]